jgi:hypothetical protein
MLNPSSFVSVCLCCCSLARKAMDQMDIDLAVRVYRELKVGHCL